MSIPDLDKEFEEKFGVPQYGTCLPMTKENVLSFIRHRESLARIDEREKTIEMCEGMKKYFKDDGISSSDYANMQKFLVKAHLEGFNSALDAIITSLKQNIKLP